MFTQADYINGWLAYFAAAIVCFWCWWYLLSKLPVKPFRPILLGAVAGLLIVPWPVDSGATYLAPAWLIAGSDGLFEGIDKFWRAGIPLLIAISFMSGLAVIAQIVWAIFSPKTDTPQK